MKRLLFAALFISFVSVFTVPAFANDVVITSSPIFYDTIPHVYTYTISATSVHNYLIQYTFPDLPNWLSFNAKTSTLSGTPPVAGQYSIHVVATDTHGATDQQNYLLFVNAPTSSPTPTQIQYTSTPSPTPTAKPTTTLPPTNTHTPTITPTPISSIIFKSQTPRDKDSITSTSPQISTTIESTFVLSKENVSISLDHTNITLKTSLISNTVAPSQYENVLLYNAQNLGLGTHTIQISITTPDTKTINHTWSFTITKTPTANALEYIGSHKVTFIVLGIVLLLFIIIIVTLIKKSASIIRAQRS